MKVVLCYILANICDGLLTVIGLRKGATEEWNPFINVFLKEFGLIGLLYYKLLLVAFVLSGYSALHYYKPTTAKRLLIVGSCVTILVASLWIR